jgi:hypothetical protein
MVAAGCGTFSPYSGVDLPADAGSDAGESRDGASTNDGAVDGSVVNVADGGDSDASSIDAQASDARVLPKRILFMTRETFDGDLGGIAGANSLCNAIAADGGLDNGVTFGAIIPGPTEMDGSVIAPLETDVDYYRADNVLIGTRQRLVDAPAFGLPTVGGLAFDQHGIAIGDGKAVWTGLNTDLTQASDSCGRFSSNGAAVLGHVGVPTDNAQWVSGLSDVNCNALVHIYCYQQN